MANKFGFWFFVGAVILVGVLFFRIVQPFLYPLMVAAVLTMLFRPLYDKLVRALGGHRRMAAAVAALAVVLLVVLPIAVGGLLASQELILLAEGLIEEVTPAEAGPLAERLDSLSGSLTEEQFTRLSESVQQGAPPSSVLQLPLDTVAGQELRMIEQDFSQRELAVAFYQYAQADQSPLAAMPRLQRLVERLTPNLSAEDTQRLRDSAMGFVGMIVTEVSEQAREIIANLIAFVIAFAIMVLAVYYFFVDGPAILRNIETLLPLENTDEEAVWEQFENVCRGVVFGTILAAFVQAILLGLGLAVVGIEHVWLLTGLTVLVSLIPFVGAAGVYIPVSIYLAWNGQPWSAVALLAYGTFIVSSSDNLVRAYAIHGSSRMHPLAALVSVLGALSLVGIWGIFVGPIVAGIFYAMLVILHQKVRRMDNGPQEQVAGNDTIKSTGDLHQLMTPSRQSASGS